MQRLHLVFLASVCLYSTITARPIVTAPSPAPHFQEVHGEPYTWLATLPGRQVRFLPGGLISIADYRHSNPPEAPGPISQPEPGSDSYEVLIWNWQWEGQRSDAQPEGHGRDYTEASSAEEIWYRNLWPGIHLRYFFTESQLKYDLIVEPWADPSLISASLQGAGFEQLDRKGRLLIQTPWGKVRDEAPVSFLGHENGRQPVESAYCLDESGRLRFTLPPLHNRTLPLVIDPLTMTWSTFLHSSGSDDYVLAITRDASQYLYVAGYTKTPGFPVTPGVYQGSFGGQMDGYVAKLSPSGQTLIWSTFLGGSDWDMVEALEIDNQGRLLVAGYTASPNFPATPGALQGSLDGLHDGFVACMSADGSSLIYSTLIGGSDRDYLHDLVAGPSGEAMLVGYTFSADFPVTSGAFDPTYNGYGDTWVACVSPNGDSLRFSTYLGGSGFDMGMALDRGPDGSIGVVGNTNSLNLPLLLPLQSQLNFGQGNSTDDGFFLRLSANGTTLLNGTYVGGTNSDGLYAVQCSDAGEWFLAGNTYSSDLLTTYNAFQTSYQGNGDVFVMRLNAGGGGVVYSSYVGGNNVDYVKAAAVDGADQVYLLGASRSANWPSTGGAFSHAGQYDAFLTQLSADGAAVMSSTLLGGSYNDYPRSPSGLDLQGNLLALAITTHSPNVPMAGNGYQTTKLNGVDDTPWIVGFLGDALLPAVEEQLQQPDPVALPAFRVVQEGDQWWWEAAAEIPVFVQMQDMQGRQLWSERPGSLRGSLNMSHLAAGTYWVRANVAGQTVVKRIVKTSQ